MYYLQSRYYDPVTARFINVDSMMSKISADVHGYNLYVYCFNNPLNLTDGSGNWPKCFANIYQKAKSCAGKLYEKAQKLFNAVNEIAQGVKTDLENCSLSNSDEEVVLEANYVSFYKGTLVIKVPGDVGLSFGIIILGNDVDEADDVKHEYGHKLQYNDLGPYRYLAVVAIPSLATYWLSEKNDWVDKNYYNMPWEYDADKRMGVSRDEHTESAEWASYFYFKIFLK